MELIDILVSIAAVGVLAVCCAYVYCVFGCMMSEGALIMIILYDILCDPIL